MKERVLLTIHDERKVLFVIHVVLTLTNTNFDFDTSSAKLAESYFSEQMKKVNKQCLLDTPRTVRVREKTCQVIVQTSRL